VTPPLDQLRVAYIGNFSSEYTTENEVRDAMQRLGIEVELFQEGVGAAYELLIEDLRFGRAEYDFVLWTRTPTLSARVGLAIQWELLATARKANVPIVGLHLDRWWGLARQTEISIEAYFHIDLLATADGAHQAEWETAGVTHRWLPPAVSERWCQPGNHRDEYACEIAFVGSWREYHHEWPHRKELLDWLSKTYGSRRFKVQPRTGKPAIRGLELNDVYWSAKVVVGDSCLTSTVDGDVMHHYCSDRIPETLGRGGILIHPSVAGIDDLFKHQVKWDLNGPKPWRELRDKIEVCLAVSDDVRLEQRERSIEFIRSTHTYTHRIQELIAMMTEEGLLS
jgi:hypothetical protein